MHISDWSSDVCSSDLGLLHFCTCALSVGIVGNAFVQRWQCISAFSRLSYLAVSTYWWPASSRRTSVTAGMKNSVVKLFQCFLFFMWSELKSSDMMWMCIGDSEGIAWHPMWM